MVFLFFFIRNRIYYYEDNYSTASSFINLPIFAPKSGPKSYKSDDLDRLRKNLRTESKSGNEKAQWIYDNSYTLADVDLYLAGNDADTIDFVYNYKNGITDFPYFPGESLDLGRKTPYFIQWDNRWAYNRLGNSNIGIAGCGPTSMAMVLARLRGDRSITPDLIAKDAESYMTNDGIGWAFFADEAAAYGYGCYDVYTDEESMIRALENGPLIASVDRGYFTLFGHILVIDSYENGRFIINDPNSIGKSKESWTYEEISDQLVKIWLII